MEYFVEDGEAEVAEDGLADPGHEVGVCDAEEEHGPNEGGEQDAEAAEAFDARGEFGGGGGVLEEAVYGLFDEEGDGVDGGDLEEKEDDAEEEPGFVGFGEGPEAAEVGVVAAEGKGGFRH